MHNNKKCWKLKFSDARNAFYVFIFIRNGARYLPAIFFLHPFTRCTNAEKNVKLVNAAAGNTNSDAKGAGRRDRK